MHMPPHKRSKPPYYLLNIAQQISKMTCDQNLKIQDIEKAVEIIKLSIH